MSTADQAQWFLSQLVENPGQWYAELFDKPQQAMREMRRLRTDENAHLLEFYGRHTWMGFTVFGIWHIL